MDTQKCDLCRLCLGVISGCEEILLNNNQYLIESIFVITGIEVVSDTGQCEFLCSQCQPLLEQCIEFRNTCINNDGVFHEMLIGSNVVDASESELEKPVLEYIKQEPVDLEDPADDVNEELQNDRILPHEPFVEPRCDPPEDDDGPKFVKPKREFRKVKCQPCGKMVMHTRLIEHLKIHTTNRRKLCCPYCLKKCLNTKVLKQHIGENHTTHGKQYPCKECEKIFNRQNTLYQHNVAVHSGEKRYACAVCGERFDRASKRLYHQRTAHSMARPYPCGSCDKTFRTKSHLTQHTCYHSKRKQRGLVESCAERKVKSENNDDDSELLEPQEAHQQFYPPKVKCDQCGILVGPYRLKKHLELHKPNRQKFCCPHCTKEYLEETQLKRHVMANHTHEIQFSCDQCGRSYVSQYSLNEHYIAVHIGEKRYPCTICGERFTRVSSRSYHQRTAHTTVRAFGCEYCPKAFKTKTDLNNHCRMHLKKKPLRKKRQRGYTRNISSDSD